MPRYELAFTPDLPFTSLTEYDPSAIAFVEEAFTDAQMGTSGERYELVTHAGLYLARLLDRDTLMYDTQQEGLTTHTEEFDTSGKVALGSELHSGGTDPNAPDWDDEGHNSDPVCTFEALMPDGTKAPVSVRIGVRRAAINGLMVVSDLSSFEALGLRTPYHFFDPTAYKNATPEALRW
jgi:hypothetical protein